MWSGSGSYADSAIGQWFYEVQAVCGQTAVFYSGEAGRFDFSLQSGN